jgi:hypothetical protein
MSTIAICIPSSGAMPASFVFDLTRMMTWTAANTPLDLRLFIVQGGIIHMQRNSLLKQALETDATHVLWLDTDMRFPRETLVHLLSRARPFVAANYVTREVPVQPVTHADDSGSRRVFTTPESEGVESVHATGMGLVLVDTAAVRRLTQPYFDTPWTESSLEHAGEDIYFCEKLKAAGVDILVDHDLSKHVSHVGQFEYRHAHAQIAEGTDATE